MVVVVLHVDLLYAMARARRERPELAWRWRGGQCDGELRRGNGPRSVGARFLGE